MSYTNKIGGSPINLASNVKIYSGTASNGEEITDEIGTPVPAQGSLYLANDGAMYVKKDSGNDANAWYQFSQAGTVITVQTDKESYSTTLTLGASMTASVSKFASASITPSASHIRGVIKSVSTSLSAGITTNKPLETEDKSVTISLGASMNYSVTPA